MSYQANTCECIGKVHYNPIQCKSNCSKWNSQENIAITQKRIWKQVRAPSSLYSMNLAALTVASDEKNLTAQTNFVNWNQMSDRINPHSLKIQNHPTRGNSTKATLTSIKPGACSPGGAGVDVKHDSYARYLARKKARNIRTQIKEKPVPLYGNKRKMYGMIRGSQNCHNSSCSYQ